ncbi:MULTISPECIES: LysR family transcriptional regulator [unclassified Ruegeria]|uniref:LysR family transcriptional regulator n=1 Tax=unclassified Ruegeria TaxID=2625375 RepID=UPI00149153EE|nr:MULTISPECIES: LysR family transcriptional regulator [unclassified Ruegeria]NOD49973.1 LysR family transcriptional regulator [Ruegeria sp. HKCCD5849]NOD54263.1 LysR family transcriptional regulator [Ruegeria sp. HKCCD5851]NOD67818.1 LysR family transcriptional regulator [Ruegeria sp. HKCCD7303]
MFIDNLRLFLTIAEKGSLVAAARESGLSTTTVSERLAALEAYYGVVLLNRTTRSISLTEEGRTLLDGAKSVLSEVFDLETRIRHGANTLSGPIRISAPVDLGRSIISQAISTFTQENPAVSIELSLSDGYVDLVGQGFDLAVRFGNVTDSTLRVRSLGAFQRLVCAAPAYLEKHGKPQSADDLADHNCLVMRFGETLDNVWDFGKGPKRHRVTVRGSRVVNDGWLIRSWALAGHGIVLKSELDVAEDIRSGALVSLLEDDLPPPNPLQVMFPPGRAQPRRVTAFAEHLRVKVRDQRSEK